MMTKGSAKEYNEVPVGDTNCPHVTAVTVETEPVQCQHRRRCVLVKLAIVATFIGVVVAIVCCHKNHEHMFGMRGSVHENNYAEDGNGHHHGKGHHHHFDETEWGGPHPFNHPPPLPEDSRDGPPPFEGEDQGHPYGHEDEKHGMKHHHGKGPPPPPPPHYSLSTSFSSSASSSFDSPDIEADDEDNW